MLLLGHPTADATVTLTNPLALDTGNPGPYEMREVRVQGGQQGNSAPDAVLSGVISGSTQSDLFKTGPGILELTGDSTFAGNTLIREGILRAVGQQRLPETTHVRVMPDAQFQVETGGQTIAALSGHGLVILDRSNLQINGDVSTTFRGIISGFGGDPSGSLTKSGTSFLELTNGTTSIDGGISVTGGTRHRAPVPTSSSTTTTRTPSPAPSPASPACLPATG